VPAARAPVEKRRIEFALVRTGTPRKWNLTSEHIASILEEEDLAKVKGMWLPSADDP
jgi:hypothetical protein